MAGTTLNFDPSTAQAGGFDPSTAVASTGADPSGGFFGYNTLKAIASHALSQVGADPRYAGIMARMAFAESGGNPQSNRSHKTSYQERGTTYYPEGLWQLSTVHGYKDDSFNPLTNARHAAELFRDQGFGPWEASRHGGAGGGWGQYLPTELGLPPTAHSPFMQTNYAAPMGGGDPSTAFGGGFDPSTAQAGGFDPSTARLATPAPAGTFDPNTARLAPAATPGAPGQIRTNGVTPTTPGGVAQDVWKTAVNLASRRPLSPSNPASRAVENIQSFFTWAERHPMDEFFALLGTPGRIGATIATEAPHGFGAVMQNLWPAIYDASDRHVAQLTSGVESEMHGLFGLPLHDAIDKWVGEQSWIPHGAKPMAAAVIKGGEDFGAQAAVDPTTFIGLGGIKGLSALKLLSPLFAGGQLVHKAYEWGKVLGIGDEVGHLKILRDLYGKTIGSLSPEFHQLFAKRPDLDVLSPEARKIRMAIESSGEARSQNVADETERLLTSGDDDAIKRRYLEYMAAHGSPNAAKRARALYKGKLPETDPTGKPWPEIPTGSIRRPAFDKVEFNELDRAEGQSDADLLRTRRGIFRKLQTDVEQREVNNETEAMLRKSTDPKDKAYLESLGVSKLGKKLDTPRPLDLKTDKTITEQLQKRLDASPLLSKLRNWSRGALLWNPFPHAIKNVGMLALLAGGPEAVMRGLFYATKGISEGQLRRLVDIGAWRPYGRLERDVGKLPTSQLLNKLFTGAETLGERFEVGWRQGLLDILDRENPSAGKTGEELLKSEFLKGYGVAEKIGDYRNQTAFVHILQSFGGPFVAFRAGIIPRNVMQALIHNPQRVLAIVRAQYDLNANREGVHKNELNFGGPPEDFAKLGWGAPGFPGLSQIGYTLSSVLPLQGMVDKDWFAQEPISYKALEIAGGYVPYVSAGRNVVEALGGRAMPGPGSKAFQHMSTADKVAAMMLQSLGMYFHAKPLPKTEAAIYKREHKAGP